MSEPHEIHSRRLGDLINYVQNIVDEVNEYLRSGSQDPRAKEVLMKKQASSISVLRQAMEMQQELLDQLSAGEHLPSRRATDPERGTPNLRTVEDWEVIDIKRRAGIES
jgi:hypothetical protein